MSKHDKLDWFIEIMKSKMLNHKEDPNECGEWALLLWLTGEVEELKEAMECESRESIIKECADVANMAYFLARKIKSEWTR